MSDDFHPVPGLDGGSVPTAATPYRPPRRRRARVLAASALLVVGIGAGGFVVGNVQVTDHHSAGFGVTTSQGADVDGARVEESDAFERAPAARVGERHEDD